MQYTEPNMTHLVPTFPFLLADVGNTGGRWLFFREKGPAPIRLETAGFSPAMSSPGEWDAIAARLKAWLPAAPATIHYYGTGCWNEVPRRSMHGMLSATFAGTAVTVFSDIEAAAHAAMGTGDGWVAILGTGSTLARRSHGALGLVYPSLGYLFTDEGSGYHIGKMLLMSYFNGRMPTVTRRVFEADFPEEERLLSGIYTHPQPNRAIARFARWVIERALEDIHCDAILRGAFRKFVQTHLLGPYQQDNRPVHFCGQIAWQGRHWLKEVLESARVEPGRFIADPLVELAVFYEKKWNE